MQPEESHVASLPGHGGRARFRAQRPLVRRFNVNVQTKRYWVPSLGRRIRLTVSAKGIKVIDARGIDAVVADLIARGRKL